MTKGTRRERQADQIYDNAGWLTYRPETSMYGTNDVFNLFDLLALGPSVLHMVQVKSEAARGIEQWCEDTLPFQNTPGLRVRMAVCYKYEGWRVIAPVDSDEHVTVLDERDVNGSMGEAWQRHLEEQ